MADTVPRANNRDKLIDAMKMLSLAKGFPSTTVDEVCAAAEVSKGSFYHHFDSKEAIGFAALDSYFDNLVEALTSGPTSHSDDPVERLDGFLADASQVCSGDVLRNGCMLGSFALDLAESHPGIQVRLAQQFDTLGNLVSGLIDDAANALATTVDSAGLAQHFLVILEGSIVLSKAHANPTLLAGGIALFTDHLNLLLGRKGTP